MSLERFIRVPLNLTIKFILFISIVVGTVLAISFYVVSLHQEKILINQIENEAKTVAQQIILMRKWIADRGGILVEKLTDDKPNPYLFDVGLIPEVKDIDGKTYLVRNPALVTRELSEYAEKMVSHKFRIVSLKPINPSNTPNSVELNALKLFEHKKLSSYSEIVELDGEKIFIYVCPLITEQSCLQCHVRQGYKVGDIRGALSIAIPIDKILNEVSLNKNKLLFIMFITIFSLIIVVTVLVNLYISRPLNWFKKSIKEFKEGKEIHKEVLLTGDEFEEISKTFLEMVRELKDYHQSLQDKIREAIKELEEVNKQLLELNTKKSDFIASAAHELRTPLTSIKGAVDYLLQTVKESKDTETISQFLEIIRRNSERLIRMVRNMLDLERIESGIMEFNFQLFNLKEVIEDTVSELMQSERVIKLNMEISENLFVYADADRIQQVISNLLINALNFSPDNSDVTIRGYLKEDKVWVEVIDNGPGIEREEQDKIFKKFYKGKNSQGTGLGLAISRAIIESHNGLLSVRSEVGKGSCFYFWIPRGTDGECQSSYN